MTIPWARPKREKSGDDDAGIFALEFLGAGKLAAKGEQQDAQSERRQGAQAIRNAGY
jgi:hypothetical protein